jgi:putative ATP-dependent endonuclease of OLD family
MRLARIGLAYFRSIGEAPAIIDLRKRVTLVIGANNSGKSNVLAAICLIQEKQGLLDRLSPTDTHLRDAQYFPRVFADLLIEAEDEFPERRPGELIRFVREFSGDDPRWIESPLRNISFDALDGLLFSITNKNFVRTRVLAEEELEPTISDLSQRLYRSQLSTLPRVVLIPQHRQIAKAESYAIHGPGIIDILAAWQHPTIGSDRDAEKFSKVQELLRMHLHLPDACLEVDHDKKAIIVRRKNLRLPLESYGTGIHQLIILAVAVLSNDNAIIAIEEPEVNLHPTLQREFLRFLLDSTNNYYLISTHSNALIEPSDQIDVLHVALVGQTTVPRLVQTPSETLALLRDLGTRASDLLQANSVIWVEGPSDRIYLNRWLSLLAPDLIEGIHYSIMFYGGRLLSHLSFDREGETPLDDLIRLLRINQYSAILIDSDRSSKRGHLNDTKRRIKEEADNHSVYCWITDGREIENYLDPRAIAKVYSELVGQELSIAIDRFGHLEDALRSAIGSAAWRAKYSYNQAKAARARDIAPHIEASHMTSDLKKHLTALVKLIRGASELHHGDS